MKYKKSLIILIILTIFLFGIASACAIDINDTSIDDKQNMPIESAQDNILKTDENNEILKDSPETFTQLDENIKGSIESFNVQQDYTFNNETDSKYIDGIVINKTNFVIEGNGHTIDGNNQSRIFNITGTNITINNLILVNGNSNMGGAILSYEHLTLNNVTFINNTASKYGGAIAAKGSFECNNSKFIDNSVDINANYCGASILLADCKANISNTYVTSKINNKISQIEASSSKLNIDNVTFANIISYYAPALYIFYSSTSTIRNSKFINLTANKTAGAIAVKSCGDTLIENCEFVNVHSSKNGGAIYADITGALIDDSPYNHGNLSIITTRFENTSSGYGGALLQLGGRLFINNSIFINGKSRLNGGSVYISFVDARINNCTFDSNDAELQDDYPTYGGALYSDYCDLLLTDSKFIANTAFLGNAIYAIDTSYNITNSTFVNNTNAIYTDFDREGYLGNDNLYNNDTVSTDNFFLATVMVGEGLELTLVDNTLNVTNLPSRYDSRDWGWVSQIKNQGISSSCWVFAMTGTLESALLRACEIGIDLSQNNMKNLMLKYSQYGYKQLTEDGMSSISTSYLVSWIGTFTEYYDSYDELGKISPTIVSGENIHIQDVIFISNFPEDNGSYLKSAIFKYGSIDASLFGQYSIDANHYYNPNTSAQYVDKFIEATHEISIIGWDDHYSKNNFIITPPGDGAWIIKNSYGKNWGDNGIGYVSYYDQTLAVSTSIGEYAASIIIENTIPYNKNYQYDFLWEGDFIHDENITYANRFVALEDDLIAGVGTYFEKEGDNYTINIYVNNELKLTQEGVSPYYGYHTVKLNKYIPIKQGDIFYAEVVSNSVPVVNLSDVRTHYANGLSYICRNGNWSDLYDEGMLANLKIYTVRDDTKIIKNKDISVDYACGEFFSVEVVTDDGHSIGAGEAVNFTINGKNIIVLTDDDGIAKLEISEVPGSYVVTTTYNNQAYKNNVSVELNLSTCKVVDNKNINVDYNGGSYFTVKVVSSDGKVVASGANVMFKINGKTKTVETDKKGIAKIKITDVPGKYTMTTTFNGKSYENTVIVKQVLTASKISVKKTAKKFTLKAKLKINGKLVKGKLITFKLNGKTYKVKTNSKGIAKKTLDKKVIKKLKKGKKYTVKVTYLKDTIKTTANVK